MHSITASLVTTAAIALATLVTGCASNRPTQTGYLPDYQSLQPVEKQTGLRAATIESWSAERSIQIAAPTWAKDADKANAITEESRAEILRLAREAFEQALSTDGFSPTTKPALELRSEITRFDTSNPAVNVVSTLALFVPLDNGGVCVEWQLVDTSNGQVLAQGVATHVGKPWNVMSSFRETGHAVAGLKTIARTIADYLGQQPRV